jgi:hypothetical protein
MVQGYAPGTYFILSVAWTWGGNPSPDFTVKAYSKFNNVNILNSSLNNNTIHYNGSSPSGYLNSTYTGMTDNCSIWLNFSNNPNVTINNITVIPYYPPNTMPALTGPPTSCF